MIDPPPTQPSASPGLNRRHLSRIALILAALIVAGLVIQHRLHQEQLWNRLLTTDGERAMQDRELTAFAISMARPLYAAHCAGCHGGDMRGNRSKGAPNLLDKNWLFGDGSVFEIERTVLYGVRSEQSKSHNITDMPAFGLTGRLSDAEIRNLVQYLLQLSSQPHQAAAASEGRTIYFDVAKANCADCHGETAQGNSNYGAPDLTTDTWRTGDDAQVLFQAIYFGQHRIMPGWIGTLSLGQVRALALYVYARSHGASDG
jgi:cytochrome c oxidase cbb3-type subunit III